MLLSSSTALAGPQPEPPPDEEAPSNLLELRSDMLELERDEVREDMQTFRPLCDAEGYPLVGNAARKGPGFQPSQFCAEVRERGSRA